MPGAEVDARIRDAGEDRERGAQVGAMRHHDGEPADRDTSDVLHDRRKSVGQLVAVLAPGEPTGVITGAPRVEDSLVDLPRS